ncbi:sn-glycerol-3-phosphate ABC transporter substrate-binding protein UgpB [Ketogulonicigenium vulgare]|uniref:sn-glycerol-3-phosphate-binding periplasmic protein UgpB n=1 Tax=Ketogulonicigenium vulgare (strain WSH-001) TaxID=759362 RepID=F9Y5S9_KETVW|nr:sn-glycerol-3-phosphate ABC transporter substrate-binding protein UgpB [Ketogulonicigenium vulgare]ADO43741.1 glycerol-3-phosphate-binding periplasmic protein precursor ugpB [Ketogulonicigenium vulgare Y25]AEM42004.1 Sn-glycerol-3-phosphate ABC transporter, substrate-binding protein [Ketogulonicigenium vulgare WSH-001]ALJ82102.1 glycerol-3-phosphate ABC transporter substrate-binding protein [Ketogulonicigenium vulgare]ANW34727.1 sn-glycerol-3-phosphate ABC transporter substrate-binding prote
MKKTLLASGTALALLAQGAYAQTEVTWWHSMSGELGTKLESITADFNASQSDYTVTPIYRGSYEESLVGTIAAFRANEQPVLVQVYEVGTGTMMAAKGAVYPVYQLMADTGLPFDPSSYLSAVVGYYSDTEGNMLSMPFNSSTPILYYNKTVFEAAGLDPEQPPQTWAEVESFSRQIIEADAASCGIALSYAATWVGTENFSAWHNQPIGTLENGFGGLATELQLNGLLQVRFWEDLKKWQDEGVFRYGGPAGGAEAAPSFYAQTCAMFIGSSASRAGIMNNATDFEVGFGFQPHYDDVAGAPQNSIIGGATLWVLRGHDEAEYQGAAAFLNYLSSAEVQADWHQATGYLPITQAAYDLSTEQGYYEANPGSDTSIRQLTLNAPTENSKGLRFGNFTQIRAVFDQELEATLSGAKTAEQALNDAVANGNQILRDFEAANQ